MTATGSIVRGRLIALGITGLFVLGCGGGTSPTSPSIVPTVPTTAAHVSGMEEAIQAEYKSEATYARVIAEFGAVLPFSTIVTAEQAHISSVATLLTTRSLPVPASNWSASNVPAFGTFREACAGAAVGERENVALYDRLLAGDLPRDVLLVYTRLRAASLDNHLPAFEACS